MMVTLDIFWLTAEQQTLYDTGVEFDYDEEKAPIVEHTFYNISYIMPDGDNCKIASNGEYFIAKIGYEELKESIQSEMLTRFN